MKIERALFLSFTAAIATAVGCTVTNSTSDGGTNTVVDGGSGDSSSGSDGAVGADGGVCDDTVVDPKTASCSPVPTGDAGCLATTYIATACTGWKANFKAGIAQRAIQCAIELPTCEGGDGVVDCLVAELSQGCPDSTAEAVCAPILAGCGDAGSETITKSNCERAVSGMTSAGRAKFTTCFAEGCALSLADCLTTLSE